MKNLQAFYRRNLKKIVEHAKLKKENLYLLIDNAMIAMVAEDKMMAL